VTRHMLYPRFSHGEAKAVGPWPRREKSAFSAALLCRLTALRERHANFFLQVESMGYNILDHGINLSRSQYKDHSHAYNPRINTSSADYVNSLNKLKYVLCPALTLNTSLVTNSIF
jgi:hypothetical protein